MDKNKQAEIILDYLETAYTGARMMDDVEMMCRLSRAIIAFNGEDAGGIPTVKKRVKDDKAEALGES